jgi:hypothetical protein
MQDRQTYQVNEATTPRFPIWCRYDGLAGLMIKMVSSGGWMDVDRARRWNILAHILPADYLGSWPC